MIEPHYNLDLPVPKGFRSRIQENENCRYKDAIDPNYAKAFRYRARSGKLILVPQYVTEDFSKYQTALISFSFKSLTSQRDTIGKAIEAKVAKIIGEPVTYAGELAGAIKTKSRVIIGRKLKP